MRANAKVVVVVACGTIIALCHTSYVAADMLRDVVDPLCSSLDADFAADQRDMSPNCHAPGTAGRHDTLEISLKAARGPAQIGRFKIADAYLYNGDYIPEVWSLDPGDSLKIAFENNLTGTAGFRTNLHVHGFIASPSNAPGTPKSPLADNIFALVYSAKKDSTTPSHDNHAAPNAVPTRKFDKTAAYLIKTPEDHPKGLFWYHPHPHGVSGPQIIGGMSGFITIGQASDYVTPALESGAVEEKLLMLKDTQINRDDSGNEWRISDEYDTGLCEEAAKTEPGVCFMDDNNAWLFPVNGQIYPTIEVTEGVGQLWRIGNIGANATYQLELLEITNTGAERNLPFQVISIDGVAVGRASNEPPIMRERLLVMPSARIEVLVEHPGAEGRDRTAIFRTTGYGTGETPDAGDNWPAIDLAEVLFVDSVAQSDKRSGLAFVEEGADALSFGPSGAASDDPDCPQLSADEVRIVTFDVPSIGDADRARPGFTPPQGCTADQQFMIMGNAVTTVEDDTSLGSILAAYDRAVGDKYASPFGEGSKAYRGKCFDGAIDTCVPYPSVQDWWVINASDEAHNFHIHQTRFHVLKVRGAAGSFTPIPDALVDNYPVLAGQAIKVRIPLNRPEQIGFFVYHCHILQHEDKGMMSAIEVRKFD